MNPFDLPPSGAPVSAESPDPTADPVSDRPRRRRTALVAILTIGLVGGGVAGVSQLASAGRADPAASAQEEPADDTIAPVDDEPDGDESDNQESTGDQESTEDQEPTGRIELDTGDGEPVVIDLGDLDMERIGELTECVGLPVFGADGELGEHGPDDWEPGELPLDLEELLGDLPFDLEKLEELEGDWPHELGDIEDLGGFGMDGGSVTVVGPDGVSVIELGDDGSVTVTADGGEISVTTDGDATVRELDDLLGELGSIFERGPALFDEELLDDELFGEMPMFEPFDPDAIQSCIDEVLGN